MPMAPMMSAAAAGSVQNLWKSDVAVGTAKIWVFANGIPGSIAIIAWGVFFVVLTFQRLEGVQWRSKTMIIHELTKQTGVPAKTIRYYESIGLLPRPKRAVNNYRQYMPADVERLRLIASARSLGFSLDDVAEILAARDGGIAPCQRVLDGIAQRLADVDRRIAGLLALRDSLRQLQSEGAILPRDDVQGEHCVCYLLKAYRDSGQVTIQRGEFFND